jgi:hypothetical protein
MSYLHFSLDDVYYFYGSQTSAYRSATKPAAQVAGSQTAVGSSAQTSRPSDGAQGEGGRVTVNQALVLIAERELMGALAVQARPSLDMYVHPSRAEIAAFERAVHAICGEALRLDLRAEELLVGIKQAWSQLATVRRRQLGDRDGDVLRQVVSSSIEVFFESSKVKERYTEQ